MEMKSTQNQKSNQKALEVRIPIETEGNDETESCACCSQSPRVVKYSSLQAGNKINSLATTAAESDDESEARIRSLVEQTSKMAIESEVREKEMADAFKSLREKLEMDDEFLRNKKEQLQRMIFQFQKDRAKLSHADHIGDCLENSNKSTEELESEMQKITARIDKLKRKVEKIKAEQPEKDSSDYKEALEKGVEELEKINSGHIYEDNDDDDDDDD